MHTFQFKNKTREEKRVAKLYSYPIEIVTPEKEIGIKFHIHSGIATYVCVLYFLQVGMFHSYRIMYILLLHCFVFVLFHFYFVIVFVVDLISFFCFCFCSIKKSIQCYFIDRHVFDSNKQ